MSAIIEYLEHYFPKAMLAKEAKENFLQQGFTDEDIVLCGLVNTCVMYDYPFFDPMVDEILQFEKVQKFPAFFQQSVGLAMIYQTKRMLLLEDLEIIDSDALQDLDRKGAFGQLFLLRPGVVVKEMTVMYGEKNPEFDHTIANEMIIGNMNMNCVVPFLGVAYDPNKPNSIFLMYEQCDGDLLNEMDKVLALYDQLGKSKLDLALVLLEKCIDLWSLGFVHRDLKFQNIFYRVVRSQDGELKDVVVYLGDLGTVKDRKWGLRVLDHEVDGSVTTSWFRSLATWNPGALYTIGSDLWALLIMFNKLLYGKYLVTFEKDETNHARVVSERIKDHPWFLMFVNCGCPAYDWDNVVAVKRMLRKKLDQESQDAPFMIGSFTLHDDDFTFKPAPKDRMPMKESCNAEDPGSTGSSPIACTGKKRAWHEEPESVLQALGKKCSFQPTSIQSNEDKTLFEMQDL